MLLPKEENSIFGRRLQGVAKPLRGFISASPGKSSTWFPQAELVGHDQIRKKRDVSVALSDW